jgi:hypothetical protein
MIGGSDELRECYPSISPHYSHDDVSTFLRNGLILPKLATESLLGEWEGVWRDRVVGRLMVVHLRVGSDKKAVLTLVSGPSHPFVEPFSGGHAFQAASDTTRNPDIWPE